MENLGHNAEGQVGFLDIESDHNVFMVVENANWEVLEVCTGQDGVIVVVEVCTLS